MASSIGMAIASGHDNILISRLVLRRETVERQRMPFNSPLVQGGTLLLRRLQPFVLLILNISFTYSVALFISQFCRFFYERAEH